MKHLNRAITGFALCTLMLAGLGAASQAAADDSANWYWHYAPLDGLTHGIGVSLPVGTNAGLWQARVNVGYNLDVLGGTLQLQQTVFDDHPQWYLASGIRALHYFAEPDQGPCELFACDVQGNQWEGTLYSRWTWGVTADNFRFDLGYGAQLQVQEQSDNNRLNWSLSPTLDAALGWRL